MKKYPRLHCRQFPLDFLLDNELIVDNFAGGGGASSGIEKAFGRPVDIAINHDPEAIALHKANHPYTKHYCESVWDIDPRKVTAGRPVGLAWFSPDCTHFSKAKGGTPVKKQIRGLAWVAIRWAATVRPRIIMLENVEEFKTWGPLTADNYPDETRKGETFKAWKAQLERLGYVVEHRELIAADYGAPTTRKRFFLIARCDGQEIQWPEETHAPPYAIDAQLEKMNCWVPAASCIDWSIPTKSIFFRKKPLAENTLRRIARGVERFVLDEPSPFIIPMDCINLGDNGIQSPIIKPLDTIGSKTERCLVAPFLRNRLAIEFHEEKHGQAKFYGFITKYYSTNIGLDLRSPLHTVPTKDRFGLVIVEVVGEQIVDIGLRMLSQREQYLAQGFDKEYKIDIEFNGRKLSKKSQQRMCGNSVSPVMSYQLALANIENRAAETAA